MKPSQLLRDNHCKVSAIMALRNSFYANWSVTHANQTEKGIVMSIPLTLTPVTTFGILTPFAFKVSERIYLLKNQI